MTNPNQPEKKVVWRAIEDVASEMGISESDLIHILSRHSPPPGKDYRGRNAIPREFARKAALDPAYNIARDRAMKATEKQRIEMYTQREEIRQQRLNLLRAYDHPISALEELHRSYLDAANRAGIESPEMASYLLVSRAIATTKILHSNLREGHWYSGSMLRDIDECLDLARFFSITKDSEEGKEALLDWFRLGQWPSHKQCRAAIAKHSEDVFEDMPSGGLELLNELYRKKSMWTHPSYASVREVTKYQVSSTPSLVSEINYTPCGDEYRLYELADFFKSSVWSAIQTFAFCASGDLGLSADDMALIMRFDAMFTKWTEEGVPNTPAPRAARDNASGPRAD